MFLAFGIQDWISHKGVQPVARCCDNNMWALGLISKYFGVFSYRCTAIECADADVGHVLSESGIFVHDLECKFTGVTENQD